MGFRSFIEGGFSDRGFKIQNPEVGAVEFADRSRRVMSLDRLG